MIGFKTVFAVIPAAEAAETAVTAFQALPLAGEARLVGLHVAPLAITYGLATDMALATLIEAQIAAADEERKAAEAAFSAAAQRAGIDFDWRAEKSPDTLVSPHAGAMARAADLILSPQLRSDASIGRHQLEEVVFASGRPVIGLPSGWSVKTLGKRIPGRLGRRPRGGAGELRRTAVPRAGRRRPSDLRAGSPRRPGAPVHPWRRYCHDPGAAWSSCGVRWRSAARGQFVMSCRRRRSISAPTFSSWAATDTPACASASSVASRGRC